MKAIEQYFSVVLFIMPYTKGDYNFQVCGLNPTM